MSKFLSGKGCALLRADTFAEISEVSRIFSALRFCGENVVQKIFSYYIKVFRLEYEYQEERLNLISDWSGSGLYFSYIFHGSANSLRRTSLRLDQCLGEQPL
jgi:hypothetical protein